MEEIRLSAKDIGILALPGFCPKCFWTKLHANNRLPFQFFPGIFSSIDSYSKRITSMHFEEHQALPDWMAELIPGAEPMPVPHHSKFRIVDASTNVLLLGAPDEILRKADGSYHILDCKTAKFTGAQDSLLPLYRAQLNAYAYIAERMGLKPVTGLGLLYYEPVTGISPQELQSVVQADGFSMRFSARLLDIDLNPNIIPALLRQARDIYNMPHMPEAVKGCRDCELLTAVTNLDPISNLIEAGHEERCLEYKESAPWEDLKYKIAKSALGMANIKGGGKIIIGVAKKNGGYLRQGVADEHSRTYDCDHILAFVNRYADPFVRIALHRISLKKNTFLALSIDEFDEVPVVCKRDYPGLMREGAIYTRSHRIPETCEVRSQTEMREILEMAVEKGMLNLVKSRAPHLET